MTTARSPLRVLKAQAANIARMLKAAERGEAIGDNTTWRRSAQTKPSITFGIVMDDKTLKIEMPWTTVSSTSEIALAEYILKHMRESRETMQ